MNSQASKSRRQAFTLVELVATMAIMSILLVGMSSAMIIAGAAIPADDSPTINRLAAMDALDQLTSQLRYATSLETTDPTTIKFAVADRGHGPAGDEIIAYSWPGTAGNPLIYDYNATARNLLEHVELLSLRYRKGVGELLRAPRVLLVVADTGAPKPQESLVESILDTFGFPVQMISDAENAQAFRDGADLNDVIYIPVNGYAVAGKIESLPIGVVLGDRTMFDDTGLTKKEYNQNEADFILLDDTHPITTGLPLGTLNICTSPQPLIVGFNAVAPAVRKLGTDLYYGDFSLMTVDAGGELLDGRFADARRVALPWGDWTFDFSALNDTGRLILQRALVWAAAPAHTASVHVAMQTDAEADSRIELDIQLLNKPR